MKCDEFLERLDADEGWLEDDAKAHAGACPSCRKAAERWSAASKAFTAIKMEDEAPPFIHTRIMARVRAEAARKPFWSALGLFRAAWAGPLLILAIAFVVGGYGLKTIIEPVRKAVPQSELAKPEEMAKGDKSSAAGGRVPTPPIELPTLGAAPVPTNTKPMENRGKDAALPERRMEEKREGASAFAATAQRDEERSQARAPAPGSQDAALAAEAPAKGILSNAPEIARKQEAVAVGGAAQQPGAAVEAFKGAATNETASAPAAPSRYLLVDLVECTLKAEGDKEYVVLKLPPSQCPPTGQLWEVTVARDGAVEVKDPQGQHKESLKEILESRIQELKLLPGRYHLGRMGQ